MKAIVTVMLKSGVLDPQGATVAGSLEALGFSGVGEVRIGKHIELDLDDAAGGADAARARVDEMCQKLLANPVIERYEIEVRDT